MPVEQRAAQVYEKANKAVNISDADIKFGREFYKELADKLFKCGPVFKLAAVEANRTYMVLDGFYRARNLK